MNKDELYTTLVAMVPVKADEEKDFRVVMKELLGTFRKHLDNLDAGEQPAEWNGTKVRAKQLCDAIERAIVNEYRGIRHSAYSAIKNQLDGYKTHNNEIVGLAYNENILSVAPGTVTYRMRKVELEEQRKLKVFI